MSAPGHPDFQVLCDLVAESDTEIDEGATVPEILTATGADPESVTYFAIERARRNVPMVDPERSLIGPLAATWIEAFTFGMRFAQRQRDGRQ